MAVGDDVIRSVRKVLKQTAVYWAPGLPNESGETTFADPVFIPCRWTDVNELFMDKQGRQATSRSKVMVDRPLALTGALGLVPEGGKLSDYQGKPPLTLPGVVEIKAFNGVPDRRGTRFYREAVL
jgi:hypothetical protein